MAILVFQAVVSQVHAQVFSSVTPHKQGLMLMP